MKRNKLSSNSTRGGNSSSGKRNVSLYSNLANNRRTKKDTEARKRAEYLATLPKQPIKRFFYKLHPKRVAKFWFSKDGLKMFFKILGGLILLIILIIGALFAYYRKDLDAIRPGEIDKRVQSTVTKYYDRNGKLLWEDKGGGNYTLVIKSEQMGDYVKQATVAIEDKDFYKHSGVSFTGLTRAFLSNAQGNAVQGGSTLTQQLVKQVFFPPDQQAQRGLSGIPRKIKEMILAIEVERMYNKDQILTLYLNESPYGGPRNGVESGAQAYFHKTTKDLTLAESALLAAIPNNPSVYNPYNTAGNTALIERQHKVLDNMVELKYITQAQADEAKKVPVLDGIFPPASLDTNKLAPHFVDMVKQQLDDQLGQAVVGNGGLTVKTTLDLDMQSKLEQGVNDLFNAKIGTSLCGSGGCPNFSGFRNAAGAIEDTQNGQVLALIGSKSYDTEGYGQNNAATAYIQPGSSIKPLVFAQLFQKQPDGKPNWGAGSIIPDNKFTIGTWSPNNADGTFLGNISIRESLDRSRNIPAIKAMQIAGVDPTWATIRAMGDASYCTQGQEQEAGLSSAIGSCGTKLTDHVNAIASLGRMGAYIPQSTILEVKNSNGETLLKYTAEKPKQVVDPQAAYIVNDILSDTNARTKLLTRMPSTNIDRTGLKIAIKTGTSDISINGKAYSKDLWTVGYTPSLSMAIWVGNPDNTRLTVGRGYSIIPMFVLDQVMVQATQQYKDQGKLGQAYWDRPAGIQTINGDIYPSYFNKANAPSNEKMNFDKVSKKKATSCTPAAAVESVSITKVTDPTSKQVTITAPAGYDPNADDDTHACGDAMPNVTISVDKKSGKASITVSQGKFTLQTLDVAVDGNNVSSQSISSDGSVTVQLNADKGQVHTVTATVTDSGYYQKSAQDTYSPN